MLGFLVLGTISVSLTHQNNRSIVEYQSETEIIELIGYSEYIQQIRPWLQTALSDQSAETISRVRSNLLNVKSSEKELGPVHMNLFLAFESWENFLHTQQESYRAQASEQLALAANLSPELSEDIQQLKKILN